MFFLRNQAVKNQFVFRISFDTSSASITGIQTGYRDGVSVVRVSKYPFHGFKVFRLDIEPSLIVFVLRQDVLEIDTLHAGLFYGVDILVIRFRSDVTAAVPLFLSVTNHCKSHTRFGTDVESPDGYVDLHREEFRRAGLGNGKHHRHVRTVFGGVCPVHSSINLCTHPRGDKRLLLHHDDLDLTLQPSVLHEQGTLQFFVAPHRKQGDGNGTFAYTVLDYEVVCNPLSGHMVVYPRHIRLV